jgi:hypothetical protein
MSADTAAPTTAQPDAEASAARHSAAILPFPPERMLSERMRQAGVWVLHNGRTYRFASRAAFLDAVADLADTAKRPAADRRRDRLAALAIGALLAIAVLSLL